MNLYEQIFYVIYKFLNAIDASYQTTENRAHAASVIMAIFGFINALTIFSKTSPRLLWWIPVVLFGLNYFCFVYKRRYIKVNERASTKSSYLTWIAIVYFPLSLIMLTIQR
jgi:hypothetical protein